MAEQEQQRVSHEDRFFDLIEAQSEIVTTAADALVTMLADPGNSGEHRDRIKDIEHRGDEKTHAIFRDLNQAMLLPQDRDAIASLASAMDDIVDYAYATANHLHLYEVREVPKELVEIGGVLKEQAHVLQDALAALRDPQARNGVHDKVVRVHALENKADDLTNQGKAALFDLDDVKLIMKLKDIYEYAETATDKCEDAADHVRHLVTKSG